MSRVSQDSSQRSPQPRASVRPVRRSPPPRTLAQALPAPFQPVRAAPSCGPSAAPIGSGARQQHESSPSLFVVPRSATGQPPLQASPTATAQGSPLPVGRLPARAMPASMPAEEDPFAPKPRLPPGPTRLDIVGAPSASPLTSGSSRLSSAGKKTPSEAVRTSRPPRSSPRTAPRSTLPPPFDKTHDIHVHVMCMCMYMSCACTCTCAIVHIAATPCAPLRSTHNHTTTTTPPPPPHPPHDRSLSRLAASSRASRPPRPPTTASPRRCL